MAWGDPRFCKACGAQFPDRWARYDKKFCDATCRKAWQRRRERVDDSFNRIMSDLGALRSILKHDADLAPKVNDHLKRIKAECNDLLLLRDPDAQSRLQMLNDVANKRSTNV